MSGSELSTVDDGVEASRGRWKPYYGLQWINSVEGRVAIDPVIEDMERIWQRKARYRLKRDASLSRDDPPRLPCRPWCNNGDEYDWEDTRLYHQPRVYQEEIDPKHHMKIEDICYTCMNHRLCRGPVCEARVIRCTHCDSEKGPLRVRLNNERGAPARKLDWDIYRLKPLHFFK